MIVELPLVIEVEDVTVDEDYQDQSGNVTTKAVTHQVVTQDDGGVLLNLLSQLDWNSDAFKKDRRDMTKLIRQLRRYNFDNSRRVGKSGTIEVEWERIRKLKRIILDEYPKDVPINGANALVSIDDFEEWYDVKVVEMKKSEEGDNIKPLPEATEG